ncbi:exopolysaccharide Pel transporter PelG [Sphingobium sp. EP60837]|jgi:polysaccharide biosynthesis protein PelG|uniref:exopolysaccharide Pel transporter PelG n=1 Tax=Sphingobium sp. EP60837 TaxID=1855519 RepID=UPI0007DE06E4|nr:exopolysaccharide Pel transporter PelG [Sphingobium sp. EP60837]ANI76557.1 hypothetical protein EP837_00102 [Sphingobium sp. EP60837]
MAGIGFKLDRLAREDGLRGIAGAACHGAVISSGPWLMTASAVLILNGWTRSAMAPADHMLLQTSLVYAFSISAVVTAPIATVATRLASDRLYMGDRDAVPSILLTALLWTTAASLIAGTLLFGLAAGMRPDLFLLATAMMTLFSQIWIAGPFLHATHRYAPIFVAYLTGVGLVASALFLVAPRGPAAVLATICGGLLATLGLLLAAVREDFPSVPIWRPDWLTQNRGALALGLAGLTNAVAVWIDKWMLWWAPDSMAALGALRVNPVNDQASFLGLLTMIPGLTLILVTTETRFDRAFGALMDHCTGTANRRRIENARRKVAFVIRRDLRLLMVQQAIIAAFCWVLAPEIIRFLNLDARGIFGLRLTALGVVFHLVAIQMSIILSYYDLFGRIVAIWSVFIIVSAATTSFYSSAGIAGFGFGYLTGAVAAASVAVALVVEATVKLTYLVFVGNNPAVVGQARLWP